MTEKGNVLLKFLGTRRLPLFLALLAVILVMPSVRTGLQLDDYVHWFYLTGHTGADGRTLAATDMFNFMDGDSARTRVLMESGILPWWTWPGLRLAFWRPLTGLTHWVDYRLWPENTVLMHLQSFLWFGMVVGVATLLYRRLNAGVLAAGLAALFFAIDDAHGLPAGWLANRNALVAAFFGLSALLFHLRWRGEGWKPGMFLGPVTMAAGLLSGEIAMGAGAFLVSFALFLDPGRARERIASLVPYAAVFVLWLWYHSHAGYGASGSGFYVDPLHDPLRFLSAVVEKTPVLLLDQFAIPPSSAYIFLSPGARTALWVAGVLAIVLLAFLFRPVVKGNPAARFFALGTVLSVPLICSTVPHSRLLLFAGFGAMGLVGIWFEGYLHGNIGQPAGKGRRLFLRTAFISMILVHGVVAPLLLPFNALGAAMTEDLVQAPVRKLRAGPGIGQKTLVIVNAPVFFYAQMIPTVLLHEGRTIPRRLRILAPGEGAARITRTDDQSLLISRQEGWMDSPFDDVYRDVRSPMKAGERIGLGDPVIDILSTTNDGRPDAVHFTFSRPLSDSLFEWKQWKNGEYVPYNPPPVGATDTLVVPPPYL